MDGENLQPYRDRGVDRQRKTHIAVGGLQKAYSGTDLDRDVEWGGLETRSEGA